MGIAWRLDLQPLRIVVGRRADQFRCAVALRVRHFYRRTVILPSRRAFQSCSRSQDSIFRGVSFRMLFCIQLPHPASLCRLPDKLFVLSVLFPGGVREDPPAETTIIWAYSDDGPSRVKKSPFMFIRQIGSWNEP